MTSTKGTWIARTALVGLLALGQGAIQATAGTSTGAGHIRGFNGVQVTSLPDSTCTSVPDFGQMQGMTVQFKLRERGSVVVMFQGQFGAFESDANARPVVRITIDDQIVGSAMAIASDPETGVTTFGFNAFSTTLRRGAHTARVLWHSFPDGATTCVEERSLIVLRP